MNCPSRTDEPPESDGYNQNPNALSNDLTTNQDLNGLANSRELRRTDPPSILSAGDGVEEEEEEEGSGGLDDLSGSRSRGREAKVAAGPVVESLVSMPASSLSPAVGAAAGSGNDDVGSRATGCGGVAGVRARVTKGLVNFGKFVGPGFMIAVAYSTFNCAPALAHALSVPC